MKYRAAALGAALTLIVAAGVLPVLTGWRAAALYQRALTGLETRAIWIPYREFRRGWNRSTATARLALAPARLPALRDWSLRIDSRVSHGWVWPPWRLKLDSRVYLEGAGRQLPALVARGSCGVWGGAWMDLALPEITFNGLVGELIARAGNGELAFDAAARSAGFGFELADLRGWLRDRGQGILRKARLRGHWDARAGQGAATLSLGSVDLRSPLGRPMLRLESLVLDLGRAERPDGLALTSTLAIDQLRLATRDDARLSVALEVTGLDPAALVDVARMWPRQGWRASSGAKAASGPLRAWLTARLANGTARVSIGPLEIRTRHGLLSAGLVLGTTGGGPIALAELPDRLVGEARLALPATMLEDWLAASHRARARAALARQGDAEDQLPPDIEAEILAAARAALAALVRDGWLVPDGERLVARATLGAGVLRVNGRALALSAAIASAPDD